MTHPDPRNTSAQSPCPWRGTASLYRLGSLEHGDVEEFESHLAQDCAECAAELEAAQAGLSLMDLADGLENPSAPRADLKDKLLACVRGERDGRAEGPIWRQWTERDSPKSADGLQVMLANDSPWQSTGVEGVEARVLRVTEGDRMVTMLVRMAAGTSYPAHRHARGEECYVLAGDLRIGERVLQSGDYQFAEAGSVHEVQSTESGCTLLLVSSQDDQRT